MAMVFSNYKESTLKFEKLQNDPTMKKKKKSNLKSKGTIILLFLSVLIYTSVFYVFDLSPVSLFSTANFWFVISNTLVLIIATDFDAFFKTAKTNDDLQEQFHPCLENNTEIRPMCNNMITGASYLEVDRHFEDKAMAAKEQVYVEERCAKITAVIDYDHGVENLEEDLEVSGHDEDTINGDICQAENQPEEELEKVGGEREGGKCVGSDSAKQAIIAENYDEDRITVDDDQQGCGDGQDEDKFSRMSDEELNTRVEEFIRRFNRQIRLQAAT